MLASSQRSPAAIASDGVNVYWVNQGPAGTPSVLKCAVSGCGGAPTVLACADPYPHSQPSAIAVDDTSVYWTNQDDGTVMKVAK